MGLPLIDVSALLASESPVNDRAAVGSAIDAACRDTGFFLVAGRIGAFQASGKGAVLLLGDHERRQAFALSFILGDALAVADPGADKRHGFGTENRRRGDDNEGGRRA